ncbi:MAG: exodeoxyribonuclease V subunit gamma [Solirubrobacterales bacterium]|nr:exodeoxyribonuclease V subunit gamma [Solirubrobacterales bacterium]
MPLTLVLGAANSAKAGEVLGGFAAAAAGSRGATLVVPTSADAAHYTRELAREGAVLGAVLTFSGLAAEIAARSGYAGRRLTRLQRERVLQQAVAGVRFGALGPAAATAGFPAAAGELVAELERTLITPARFSAAMEGWARQDPRRAGYARDVAAIYTAYAARLDQLGRDDSERFAWHALDALRAAPGRWGPEPVFFYGFDDLHPLERDAIETLARVVGAEVTVSLTYEAGREALTARAEVVEELRPLAERVLELPALGEHYAPGSKAVLHHLERGLFEPSPERADPGEAITLLEAGGELGEAEVVGAEVLAALRAGTPAEEIAVVYRSPERSGPLIERVFRRYGIPVALERMTPFAATSLGRGLLGLARCALLEPGRAGAGDLLEYLRAIGGGSDRRQLEVDRVEAEVRRRGVRSARQAVAVARAQGFALEDLDALRAAEGAGSELVRQARGMLSAWNGGRAPVFDAVEQLDATAVGALERALAELAEVGDTPTGGELVELLERLELPVASASGWRGAVLVSDPLSIRARRFRVVLVCGLQENEFPLAAAPEPFLSDELRRELAACSGLRLRPREDALARERYLFYTSVSRATERVILSYRSSDEEGNLALPSPFLDDVSELLVEGWRDQRRRRLLADVVWPASAAPTERELARARAAAGAPATGDVPSPIGSLGEVALAHVRHSQILSAGALETYADCPVKWLVDRELQPDPLEPDPDALARGSYMHAVLEAVFRRLAEPVTPESLPRALELLDEALAETSHGIAAGRGEAVRAGWTRAVAADLWRYLAYEARDGSTWPIRGLELRFGFDEPGEEGLPPLELSDAVRLRGIIDRVDADADGHAVVRDYKSGSARPEHQGARWQTDRQLQVALYMIAVRQLLGLEPVAGFYQPLGGGDLRARGVFLKGAAPGERLVGNDGRDPEELKELLEEARGRALALAARLRAGSLEPCPATCSRDGCSYPGICRA